MAAPAHRAPDGPRPRPRLLAAVTAIVCLAVVVTVVASFTLFSKPAAKSTADPSPVAAQLAGNTLGDRGDTTEKVATGAKAGATSGAKKSKPMKIVPGIVFHRLPPAPPKPTKADLAKAAEEKATTGGAFDVAIGTFNVLGSQHSVPGGDKPSYPPASVRTARAAGLIIQHGIHVLGAQEIQDDQLRDLQSRLGFAAYPGFAWGSVETDNSILYDPDLYEFVSGSRFTVTFVGRPRPQPILRLRDRATGREFYVVNTHPSPGGGQALAERRRGQATVVSVINNLKETGLPVFTTGDMNDRQEFYCNVVTPAQMSAPNGGSTAGGCHPPPMPLPVDWVVGSGVASWSNYWRDTRTTEQKISDHILVSALAHVG